MNNQQAISILYNIKYNFEHKTYNPSSDPREREEDMRKSTAISLAIIALESKGYE
jgi:hypothetical protein